MGLGMVSGISYTRLTLALDVIRKLDKGPYAGYHELGIIKQRITLGDTIKIDESQEMAIRCNHPGVPLDDGNICWKAVELLQKEFGIRENVEIDIDKVIPVQGGLAGGSTNAATVITLLDEMWKLGLDFEEKVRLGRKLGMDVPFYFTGGTAFDTEATGVLSPFDNGMKMYFLLVVPPFGVSTADAYRGLRYDLVGKQVSMTQKLQEAIQEKKYYDFVKNIHNDFELSVLPAYPKLSVIRDQILQSGADKAFMSGSGSTMVGVFSSIEKIRDSAGLFSNSIIAESF